MVVVVVVGWCQIDSNKKPAGHQSSWYFHGICQEVLHSRWLDHIVLLAQPQVSPPLDRIWMDGRGGVCLKFCMSFTWDWDVNVKQVKNILGVI